jgi:transposase-like protein
MWAVANLPSSRHKDVRKRKITGTGGKDKTIEAGTLQRGGQVRTEILPDTTRKTFHAHVNRNVERGASLYTDTHSGYSGLDADYDHRTVDHAERYADDRVHTNGMENFWSLLKRGLHGTYISVEPFHLFRYLDERAFTFNLRDVDDFGRFSTVLAAVSGRRLTWAQLTGR